MMVDHVAGSYRDPGGFLYWRDGILYRQVNEPSAEPLAAFESSGLYAEFADNKLIVEHETVGIELAADSKASMVIKPRLIETLSYPYEWSFSQLKDAALLTLDIQARALRKNFSLKDASAYNVQFDNGKTIFIDTLSFDHYQEGKPWVAYGQFCRHFLAPLALMAHIDVSLNKLLRTHIDGVPITLAAKLLPTRALLRPSLAMHIWMHARTEQQVNQNRDSDANGRGNFSRNAFLGLIDSLRNAVNGLQWRPGGTEWFDYYEANNNYGEAGLEEKEQLVHSFLERFQPRTVWDLGGNTGRFSRIAAALGASVVCFDIDPGCVESNYLHVKTNGESKVLPLLMDLGNPSPGLGWASAERISLAERGPADVVMALGLVHHLAIGINVPFAMIAEMFSRVGRSLVIEFIPRGDSQIDKLLSTRNDVFVDYHEDRFRDAFSLYFNIVEAQQIPGTKRTLYAMEGK